MKYTIVGWTGGESKPSADEQATQVLPATGEQPAAEGEATKDQPIVVGTDETKVVPQPTPMRDLPAGVDPGELAAAPIASARRGKLRRRLRYLRAVRDLLLRDLGGFLYEVQRTAGGTTQDVHRRLIETKTNRIATLDTGQRCLRHRGFDSHHERRMTARDLSCS